MNILLFLISFICGWILDIIFYLTLRHNYFGPGIIFAIIVIFYQCFSLFNIYGKVIIIVFALKTVLKIIFENKNLPKNDEDDDSNTYFKRRDSEPKWYDYINWFD
jgi:hypothetical protein